MFAPLPVGPPIVVGEGLGKVVAVGKRSAGDRCAAPVRSSRSRPGDCTAPSRWRSSTANSLARSLINCVHLLVDPFLGVEIILVIDLLLLSLGDQPRTFHPRPGTQPANAV